jgi:tRNA C32,U32 (ribose-2'-O)-methylase TrmJ
MASVSEDELARLSGTELIAHLSDTCCRADFDAVARILKARDLREARIVVELRAALADLNAVTARGYGDAKVTAELQATLTEMEAVRDMSKALLDVFPPT